MEYVVQVKDLIKIYNLYDNTKDKIKSIFLSNRTYKKFYALNGINLDVKKGESLGLIGINGSGKSTLANIIGGLTPQTSGSVETNGKISLLSISAGLNNELSGRENIELKCLMLGLSKKEIKDIEPEIIEFSELGNFIDQPVKKYSSGMRSRLGFSISITLDPDILIIDEALSVGDKAFADKCLAKMEEFKAQGKSMIFVSHSISQMKKFCDRILWLDSGRVKAIGKSEVVLKYYDTFLKYWLKLTSDEKKRYREISSKVPVYKKIDNNDILLYEMGVNEFVWDRTNFVKDTKRLSTQKEPQIKFISELCHFKESKTKVFKNPMNQKLFKYISAQAQGVHHIKKVFIFNEQTFYLVSTKNSFKKNIIGWVNERDLTHLPFTHISYDQFSIKLNGKGKAMNAPWGRGKQISINDLTEYKDIDFLVKEICYIGNNLWFYGKIRNINIWINSKYTNFTRS